MTRAIRQRLIAGGALLLTTLLSGCTVGVGLYVRNNYLFPISVHEPFVAYDGQAVDAEGGTVPPGQQRRMNFWLSRSPPQVVRINGPNGKFVQQVSLTDQQINDAYQSHHPAAALYLGVGTGRTSIASGIDTVARNAQVASYRLIAVVVGAMAAVLVTGGLIAWRLKARRR